MQDTEDLSARAIGCTPSPLQEAMAYATSEMGRLRFAKAFDFTFDPPRLLEAIRDVARDWEVLRTRLAPNADGTLQQWISPQIDVCLRALPAELCAVLESDVGAWKDLWAWVDTQCEHNDKQWVLATANSSERGWLVGWLPAAVFDEFSVELLASALIQRMQGDPLELPLQYADVSVWMVESAASGPMPALTRGNAGAGLRVLELQSDPLGIQLERWLPPAEVALARDVDAICARSGAPAEIVLIAHLAAVLAPISEQANLCVGLVREGRALTELEGCPGRFSYVFPFVIPRDARVGNTVLYCAAQCDAMLEWDLRFDLPLCTAKAGYVVPEYTFGYRKLEAGGFPQALIVDETMQGCLHVQALRQGDAMQLEWRYDRARLPAESVQLLHDRLRHALALDARGEDGNGHPGPDELQRIAAFAGNSAQVVADDFLSRYHTAVQLYPRRIALRCVGENILYEDLHARVMRLAATLNIRGIGPGMRVAILARDPRRQVVAILATMQVGAAFVPLDSTWPHSRIAMILDDARATVVVDDMELEEEVSPLSLPVERVAVPNIAEAYLVYTSGSTGRPKGVVVTRSNLAHYLYGLDERLEGSEPRSWAAIGSFAADLTYTSLFGALARGDELHLYDREWLVSDLPRIIGQLEAEPVDILKTVPSLVESLLQYAPDGRFLPVQTLVMGGEVVPPGLYATLQRIRPECRLINHYGPTETTIGAAADWVEFPPRRYRGVSDAVVGRPLAHVSIHVLDHNGQPVGIGEIGEVWIGGGGVAQGYENAPAMTAERFVADPATCTGGRRYRTGDLGRWLVDGRLEFLGRNDGQIKLHGYRVELAEIEHRLRCLDMVSDAAVIARKDDAGTVIALEGFVTVSENISVAVLREQCRVHLPEQMVPARIRVVTTMPRMTNGKLDYAALVTMAKTDGDALMDVGDTTQARVAGILSDVLGRKLSVHDDFFVAGGNSLLAIRAVARINREFVRQLSPQVIFDYPTSVELAAEIVRVQATYDAIMPVARTEALPLSFVQQRLWFASQMLDPSAFNVPLIVGLHGRVEPVLLLRAIANVCVRHEILRCRFVEGDDGQPELLIVDDVIASDVVDASNWNDEYLAQQVDRFVRRPFDLISEPPFRARIFVRSGCEATLALAFHHIASDAWSIEIFLTELGHLLRDDVQTKERLPQLPIQYADYAAWQHSRAQRADSEATTQWRRYLEDIPAPLGLDASLPVGYSQTGAGQVRCLLPQDLVRRLRHCAQTFGVTLNSVLFGGFLILIRKLTRENDLVVGSPQAARARPELEPLIGPFFNLVPMRVRLAAAQTAEEVWRSVHQEQRDIWHRGEFDLASRELPRGPDSLQPWFNVVFAHREVIETSVLETLPELSVTWKRPHVQMGHYDLFCAIETSEYESSCVLEFRKDRIGETHAHRIAEWLVQVLDQVSEHPQRLITDVVLYGPEATLSAAPKDDPEALFPRLCRHVETQPHAPALWWRERWLDYSGLQVEVDRIAAGLRASGMGPGDRVALMLERSADLPLVILGLWRAGLVYLPLELSMPAERRSAILGDARPAALLVDANVDDMAGVRRIDVESLHHMDLAPLEPWVPMPDAEAYVIYTSGSTGEPKGVSVTWRTLTPFLAAMEERLGLVAQDRLLATTGTGFDISILELVLSLYCGGAVEVAPQGIWQTPDQLQACLDRGTTVLQATPSAWRLALPHLLPGRLRHILVGGEAMPADLASALCPLAEAVWNLYGPTEATIWVAVARVDSSPPTDPVSIAGPLPGVTLRVRDIDGQPAPWGLAGELSIEGVLVADRYLNRPRLTSERFLPSPAGMRRFRSGDLMVMTASDQIQFLGRIDDMLKLNGHRIEPAEIEAVLRRHPAVADAAVRLASGGTTQFLAAYVIACDDGFFEHPEWWLELREFTAERLPPYMLPAVFETLKALPVNSNGKLDRRRLPEPRRHQQYADLSASEQLVATCIGDLIGHPVCAADEDFFALGGDSVSAVRLIAELHRRSGRSIELRDLFRSSSVAGIARTLNACSATESALPSLRTSNASEAPLSPYQQGIWIAQQLGHAGATYHVSAAIVVCGEVITARLQRALDALCIEQEQLCIRIEERGGRTWQYVDRTARLQLVEVDLCGCADLETHVAELLARWRALPFDLSQAGYCRVSLIRLEASRQIIAITLHHLVADEWSWWIILERLQVLYAQDRGALIRATHQYVDYAHSMADAHEWLQAQGQYWTRRLAGAPSILELPQARTRPPKRLFRGDWVPVVIPVAIVRALQDLALREQTTLFSTLLAAYSALLHLRTGRCDVLVGTAVANRRLAGTQTIVGNFSNVLALRIQVRSEVSARSLVQHAAAVLHEALNHQEFPFRDLVSALGLPPSTAFAPIVQNVLVLHNTPKPMPGTDWEVSVLAPDYRTSEYDLDLGLTHSAGGLTGYLRFNADLYGRDDVEALAAQFVAVAERLGSHPGEPVSTLLAEAEKDMDTWVL